MKAKEELQILHKTKELHLYNKINLRVASRAIINKNNKYLMVYLKKDDAYEFPGGGVEKNESLEDALIREVFEETGYSVINIKELIFKQIEMHEDSYNKNELFKMENYFFEAEILYDDKNNKLINNNSNESIEIPLWCSLEFAIDANKKYLEKNKEKSKPWVVRSKIIMEKYKDLLLTTAST